MNYNFTVEVYDLASIYLLLHPTESVAMLSRHTHTSFSPFPWHGLVDPAEL